MEKLHNVNCPVCGKEMERGYIFSSHEVAWTKDGKSHVAPGLYEKETLVEPTWGFRVKKKAAHRCEACKIVLFEYDPQL